MKHRGGSASHFCASPSVGKAFTTLGWVIQRRILSIILRILVGLLAPMQMPLFEYVAFFQGLSARMGSHRPSADVIGWLVLHIRRSEITTTLD